MCGINGIISLAGQPISNGANLLTKMNKLIEHRGPDDSGIWHNSENSIYFGHQRLSILDLSSQGHQPMVDEVGNVIVFNGEIYNFKELKEQLRSKYTFRSSTDTEVILALYREYGENLLEYLNGMFAFCLWDPKKRSCFLARDRIGIKPLYYVKKAGVFAFSSELRTLLALPWVDREIEPQSFYNYLTYNKVSAPETIFAGIKKFEPAHKYTLVINGREKYQSYWNIKWDTLNDNETTAQTEFLDVLESAVKYRMVSDVPVGAFLSGGVDSSAIVALASKYAGSPMTTFSVGFEGVDGFDERQFARQISNQFGTNHIEQVINSDDIKNLLPKLVDIFDEPLADATSIPIHLISKLAKENDIKVILTGDGADELFFGYRNWFQYTKFQSIYTRLEQLPRALRLILKKLAYLMPASKASTEIIKRALDKEEFFLGGAGGLKETIKRSILSSDFLGTIDFDARSNSISRLKAEFDLKASANKDLIRWMSYVGTREIIPNYYLYRADRLGMANSIELRVPFLDHNVVNYAFSIDSKLKTKNQIPKYIVKKSLESILPRDILYRKKQGFCVPLNEWLKKEITSYLKSGLTEFCSRTGYFNSSRLASVIKRYEKGDNSLANSIWNIYFFMAWHNRWINA